jgi:DNA (cytosine-5)-methyltransferase 1
MSEVEAVRGTNGYKVVSTFSGCGGACLGFEMAGFEIVWASEFVEEARRTYQANHPGVPVDGRDIREVTAEEILAATGLERGDLDVFEGSPPCASFSTAGKREKGWGEVKAYSDRVQRSDDLFFEYARLLDGLQPRVFTAENVSGLVKGKAIGYFKEILTALRSCGYAVEAKVLDASWLGVPQARQRLIFVGVRNDLVDRYKIRPAHPAPRLPRYAIRDVLEIDGTVIHDTRGSFGAERDVTDRPAPTITDAGGWGSSHFEVREKDRSIERDPETGQDIRLDRRPPRKRKADPVTHDPETGQDITLDRYAIGAEWDKIRPGESSERYFQLVRPSLREPVGTITATGGGVGAASVTHPTQKRKFTLEELRILSSFPADFSLTGTYAQRWERIGRSVPPFMAKAIAETIRDEILRRLDDAEG